MDATLPLGVLLSAQGRVWPRGVHTSGQSLEHAVPRHRLGAVGLYGGLRLAAHPTKTRDPRDAQNSHDQRRWPAIFHGFGTGVCDDTLVDDTEECTALCALRHCILRLAVRLLHALLHGSI